MPNAGAISVGAARVTLLNAGDLVMMLKDDLNVPESEWRPSHAATFEVMQRFPSLSVLIECDGAVTLVDIGDYAGTVPVDSAWLPPGYTPPPGIIEQLAAMGIAAGDVGKVVITHAHWDHFAGTTTKVGDDYVPTFPNATYYLGRGDWEREETRAELADAESLEARTLGVLDRQHMLTLVDGEQALSASVSIISAPGESPGHQVVRVASEGRMLYCVGDLFHHPVEAEHPEWMAAWANPAPMLASRLKFIEVALREDALLTAAHIAGFGRLVRTDSGVRWVEA